MEKVAGEQGLALQQHVPQMSSKFSEDSIHYINLLLNDMGLKLGQFAILMYSFLAFQKYLILKIGSCDPSCKGCHQVS